MGLAISHENRALPRYPKKAPFPRMAALANEIMGKRHEGRPGFGAYKRCIRAAELWEQAGHQKRAAKLYEKAGDQVGDWLLYSHAAWLLEKIAPPQAVRLYEKAVRAAAGKGDAMLATADSHFFLRSLLKDAAVFYGHALELYTETSQLCLRAAGLLEPGSRKALELKNLSDEFLGRASDLKSKKAEIESEVSSSLL